VNWIFIFKAIGSDIVNVIKLTPEKINLMDKNG